MTDKPSGQLRIRIPKCLHLDCKLNAKKEGISLNTYIITALGYMCNHSDLQDFYFIQEQELGRYSNVNTQDSAKTEWIEQ